MKVSWKILTTPEFQNWLLKQTEKEKHQIRGRLSKVELEGYFGDFKSISSDNILCEFR